MGELYFTFTICYFMTVIFTTARQEYHQMVLSYIFCTIIYLYIDCILVLPFLCALLLAVVGLVCNVLVSCVYCVIVLCVLCYCLVYIVLLSCVYFFYRRHPLVLI